MKKKDPGTILDCSNVIFINQKPVTVKTLTSKVIYAEIISRIYKKPIAQQNVESKLRSFASQTIILDWKKILCSLRNCYQDKYKDVPVPPA